MSCYFVANIRITNKEIYQKYLDSCDEVFSKFKGNYLAVDENPEILEGSWNYSKVVIIEFNNKDDLNLWYKSNSYQEILKYRLDGSDSSAMIVQGR